MYPFLHGPLTVPTHLPRFFFPPLFLNLSKEIFCISIAISQSKNPEKYWVGFQKKTKGLFGAYLTRFRANFVQTRTFHEKYSASKYSLSST